jgi:hypothetical protein
MLVQHLTWFDASDNLDEILSRGDEFVMLIVAGVTCH